jgi:hypothetical protein
MALLIELIYPNIVAPLFNKFEELNEGALKESINALATHVKFP